MNIATVVITAAEARSRVKEAKEEITNHLLRQIQVKIVGGIAKGASYINSSLKLTPEVVSELKKLGYKVNFTLSPDPRDQGLKDWKISWEE